MTFIIRNKDRLTVKPGMSLLLHALKRQEFSVGNIGETVKPLVKHNKFMGL